MRVHQARRVARDWVLREAIGLPGFVGAYVAGSINWLTDDAELPATSDLDVNLVLDGEGETVARRKLVEQGVLLEASTIRLDRLRSPEQVLADFALAGGFRVPSVIADPTGHLTMLQTAVSRDFADPAWVRRRCEHAQRTFLAYLDALHRPLPFQTHGIVWAFGTSGPTLLPLVASLRNPTVRRRYVAARELLAEHGRPDLYEQIVGRLGCAALSRARVEHHLAALAEVYDAAVDVARTPFPFSADISALTRPVAIGGSRELIERGLHREAVFWLVVTYARCQEVLAADAPALLERFTPGFLALLTDLGVASPEAMRRSAERTRALLPEVWAASEAIIAAG